MNIDLRRHKDLLNELDRLYPLRNFEPQETDQAIREHCAKRFVVDRLFQELQYQEEQLDMSSQQVTGKPNVQW